MFWKASPFFPAILIRQENFLPRNILSDPTTASQAGENRAESPVLGQPWYTLSRYSKPVNAYT